MPLFRCVFRSRSEVVLAFDRLLMPRRVSVVVTLLRSDSCVVVYLLFRAALSAFAVWLPFTTLRWCRAPLLFARCLGALLTAPALRFTFCSPVVRLPFMRLRCSRYFAGCRSRVYR